VPVRGVRGSPLGRRHGVAAAVIAASSAAENGSIGITRRILTVMRTLPPATGMGRRSRSLERKRCQHPRQSKQQQKSCGQALHVSEW